ncbi:YceD family protein [Pelagibacterium halotolerans]|uniref:YceD family protein n=1 Tax=Pelagibacterium halotolerans TaxID=531813 RepID=UPI0038511095
MTEPEHFDLDARVKVDKIPAEGRVVTIETDDDQRTHLADRFQVSAVNAFAATVTATRFRGGVRAQGRVTGEVVQPCVITRDPVVQKIDEPVDRVFLPGRHRADDAGAGAEVFVNLEDEDFPDYFEGDEIDLADLVMEVFALAIDLYPRAPGAHLPDGVSGDDPAEASPFAALKSLKKD